MSDCVPDFHDMLHDYDVPTSSASYRKLGEEDMMELMWQNGQVVVQRTSTKKGAGEPVEEPVVVRQNNEEEQQQNRLFMQEDEMASWLHYPLDDSDFYADMLYSAAPPVTVSATEPLVTDRSEILQRSGFGHFSRIPNRPAVVDSRVSTEVMAFHPVVEISRLVNTESGVTGVAGGIGRKRKDKEREDSGSQGAGIEFEAAEAKKQAPGSSSTTTTKRSRAAQVHSLSERRRRDRINEKMKALQQLIPRCNKTDKASMLDEAIEYLKSLQMQVQMMSMGYGMMPMMYPGMQQYMPAMGMGMGMNRPMVPYPPMVQGSGIPNPAAAAHMVPRFPMPAFNHPPVRIPDPSRIHASNQVDPMLSSQMPSLVDLHQQFLGLQQAHLPLPQNPLVGRANTDNFNTSQETGNRDHQRNGLGC